MFSGYILPNKPPCRFITHAYSPHESLREEYLKTIFFRKSLPEYYLFKEIVYTTNLASLLFVLSDLALSSSVGAPL